MSQAMITDAESTLPQEIGAARAVTAGMPDDSGLEHFTRILDCLLDDTIRRLQGEQAFHLVDDVRAAGQELRANPSLAAARALRDRLVPLDLSALRTLTRAFSLYFDLINLGEQRARVRALRRGPTGRRPSPSRKRSSWRSRNCASAASRPIV